MCVPSLLALANEAALGHGLEWISSEHSATGDAAIDVLAMTDTEEELPVHVLPSGLFSSSSSLSCS